MQFNFLQQYPKFRKPMYTVQWVVNLLLAIITFVMLAYHFEWMWVAVTQGSFNIVWGYLGMQAQKNVNTTPPADTGV